MSGVLLLYMSHLNSLDHWIASAFGYLMMYNNIIIKILRDIRKTTNFHEYCKTAPNHRSLTLRHVIFPMQSITAHHNVILMVYILN